MRERNISQIGLPLWLLINVSFPIHPMKANINIAAGQRPSGCFDYVWLSAQTKWHIKSHIFYQYLLQAVDCPPSIVTRIGLPHFCTTCWIIRSKTRFVCVLECFGTSSRTRILAIRKNYPGSKEKKDKC